MTLVAGTQLGPYEIQSPLGAGGMGEVYRARDTRLGRDVAIKVLPDSFTRDTDRLARFEQEARAVAALNHPNILAIHDVGKNNDSPFLVSELLEGESLRSLLEQGALPQRRAIEYGVQTAQGLAAAHEKSIVHRDLKPENLFITKDGRVKILDFGLAKLATKSAESNGRTMTSAQTSAGTVMGTASYMAPEQVRGEAVDPRTDIFAFGAVLYEMLSGQRAFHGGTPAETMTSVLREDPPELSGPAHTLSPALDKIVRRCLEKAPDQRFQSARDLSFALSALSGSDTSAARVAPAPRKASPVLWVGMLLGLIVVAGVTWLLAKRPAALETQQFAISVPGEVSNLAISVDGSMLAFVSPEESSGLPMLYVQRVGSPSATLLAGTEGASFPFWSPDGAMVAFFANGKLQKMPASGGTPQVLASVLAARGGSWGSRGVIIYAPDAGSEIWRINADGTNPTPVTRDIRTSTDNTQRWPMFLPDGNHFLFWSGNFGNAQDDRSSGIYATTLDGKERKLVLLVHSSFGFDSHSLYYADHDGSLTKVAFDSSKASISGSPITIANMVGFQPSTYWAAIAVSENGTLIYNPSPGAAFSVLTWMDRSGKELGRLGDPAVMANPTFSPDGKRIALDISDQKANNVDVWLESTTGAGNTRFTFDPAEEVIGVWSRDGTQLAYRANFTGGSGLMVKQATGVERELTAVSTADDILPNSWSADDQQVLCTYQTPEGSHLSLVPVAGGKSTLFLSTKGSQSNAQISPDGKWVAYASNESGDWEIYVTTFPGAQGKWQVSRGGGTEPRWRGDGKEIFYLGPRGTLTAVVVSGESAFPTSTPVPLFQFHGRAPISSTDIFSYDVTKDGKNFLVNRYLKPEHVAPLTIVLHASEPQK